MHIVKVGDDSDIDLHTLILLIFHTCEHKILLHLLRLYYVNPKQFGAKEKNERERIRGMKTVSSRDRGRGRDTLN